MNVAKRVSSGLGSSSRDKRERSRKMSFDGGGGESCTRFVMDQWSIVGNHVFVPALKIFISSEECRGLSTGLEATKTSPEQIWSAIRILVMEKSVKNKKYLTQFPSCEGNQTIVSNIIITVKNHEFENKINALFHLKKHTFLFEKINYILNYFKK